MRVLIVGPDLDDPGGVANYYNAVLPRLSVDGIEVQYLQIGSTHGGRYGLHIIADQFRLWHTIGRFEPNIVHINPSLGMRSFLRDGVFVFIARLRQSKVLVFFRGWQQSFEERVTGLFRWFFQATYAKADCCIVLADTFAGRLRAWGVTAPIALTTTVVADELLEDLSIDRKIADINTATTFRLLYLARLERDKGVLELIDSFDLLVKRGVGVSLTVAGDGPVMSQVRKRVVGLDGARVQVVGYVRGAAKKELLQSHHVFCFPTRYGEGMPNAVLEAMGTGMAIVTCPVGGIADFFVEPDMGILLEKVDPPYIADKLESLISSRGRLAAMALSNYNYALKHFHASVVAADLRARYKTIVSLGTEK